MKLVYSNWHKELVHDDTIQNELQAITEGQLEFNNRPFVKHRTDNRNEMDDYGRGRNNRKTFGQRNNNRNMGGGRDNRNNGGGGRDNRNNGGGGRDNRNNRNNNYGKKRY
jgi:hypothetical protein